MKRRILKVAAIAGAASLLLAGCSSDGDSGGGDGDGGSGSVTYAAYGGSSQDAMSTAWLDPFSEESGVTVLTDAPVSWARVQEMVDAKNVIWDVVHGTVDQGVTDNPALEMIDCDIVDCTAFDDAAFLMYPQAVPLFTYSWVVTYNTDTFAGSDAPTGFSDFFDPSFEGSRMLPDTSLGWKGILEAALIYDGVDRDDLYPLDVDRALSVIDGIKDQLIVMSDDSQCVNMIASGEASMGVCFNGRVGIGIEEGLPLAIAWGQQIQTADYLYIPKGTPNLENAQKLVAYIVEHQGAISDYIAYSPVNPNSPVSSDSTWIPYLPSENEMSGDQAPIAPDLMWWSENLQPTVEAVSAWLQS